jgi:hypothetical protein
MKGQLIAVVLLAATGCSSSHHRARYESPYPPRTVVPAPAPGAVIVTPPPGSVIVSQPAPGTVVVPALTEMEAAEIARAEAYRHGWRHVRVERARFWENRWHVDISSDMRRRAEQSGWVDVGPDGTILAFGDRPHQHAGYRR